MMENGDVFAVMISQILKLWSCADRLVSGNSIRIYHECEGRTEKKPSRGLPFDITSLAE